MNWFKKSKLLSTQDLPDKLTQAIQYECGGEWEHSEPNPWTERLDAITGKELGQEKGYSTSFWVTCKTGDGFFNQKWGVSVNFTVMSGQSHTTFESEKGDWDLTITANVQWASPASWTPQSPYALFIKTVGHEEGMKTIQQVADFVKMAIWKDQQDDENEEGDEPDEPEYDPTPDSGVESTEPVGIVSPV